MKDLLTITMSPRQVREACEQWAVARSGIAEPCAIAVAFSSVGLKPEDTAAEVVFTKKRVRASKRLPSAADVRGILAGEQ